MIPILNFTQFIVAAVLTLLLWIVVAYVIMANLIAFNIVKLRNRIAANIWTVLESVTLPILRPIRRVVPPLGMLDLSAFLFMVVVIGINNYLIPPLFDWLRSLAGGVAY